MAFDVRSRKATIGGKLTSCAELSLVTQRKNIQIHAGQPAVDDLMRVLNLEKIDENIFRGSNCFYAKEWIFGGQLASQALMAAGSTVPADRAVHSLHSYFVRPGDLAHPVLYTVDRIMDGRGFSKRRVSATQRGKLIFELQASFQLPEPGIDYAWTMPPVTGPEYLPTFSQSIGDNISVMGSFGSSYRPVDVRYITDPPWHDDDDRMDDNSRMWLKIDGEVPADALLHTCLLVFASDMTVLDPVFMRHGAYWGTDDLISTSLDHTLWFHRAVSVDDWIMYDCNSPTIGGARGFSRGEFYSGTTGKLVATVVQEGLMRQVRA